MTASIIAQHDLKKILDYNPTTGVFTWRAPTGRRTKVGSVAGTRTNKGYITIRIRRRFYKAHRLAFLWMTGEMPEQVDHINRIRNDNRWHNIRAATHALNNRNRSIGKSNTSGVKGVFRKRGKWCAEIGIGGGKAARLYYGADFGAACRARLAAELELGYL